MVLGLPRRPKGLTVPLETPKVRKNPDRSYEITPQGDVVAILDSTDTMMVNYYYDAYGMLMEDMGKFDQFPVETRFPYLHLIPLF